MAANPLELPPAKRLHRENQYPTYIGNHRIVHMEMGRGTIVFMFVCFTSSFPFYKWLLAGMLVIWALVQPSV